MKDLTPLFSIIIPTYNSETTLEKCLYSIISQSFHDFEVLIIDGVSIDFTLKIAEKYDDSRLKIVSEPDKGIYDAMNKGIRLAKGEWIYFLGSDDFMYSKDVLKQIKSVIDGTNRYVIYGNVMVNDVEQGDLIYDGKFSLEKLLYKNICHQSIFYRNIIFNKVGSYDIDYSINADWDFNLRCRSMFKFQYVNIIIAFFSTGGHSQTGLDRFFFQDYLGNITKYFFWQFYKKDFHQLSNQILEKQLKEKHFVRAFVIILQIKICHFRILISKTKRKICSRL